MNPGGAGRQKSPCDHDAGKPFPGAPHFHENGSRNLEQNIAKEENTAAQAEDGVRKTELARHVEPGEPQIDAIEIGHQIQEEQKWHQSTIYPPSCSLSDFA